jgi:phosphate uptake regulator
MTYRKIIGFGEGSFVVSLPKDWISKNGLKKGDVVNLEPEGNDIKICTITQKQSKKEKEYIIEFEGDIKKLKAQLIYAYINNYDTIIINGKNLFSTLDELKLILDDLVALEIVQKASNKIILKDFLNIQDFSVRDTIRRVDRIVMSMTEDVKNYLTGKDNKSIEELKHKDKDISRLTNLLFKTLKKSFNSVDRTILGLNLNEIFYYWELTLFIEKVAHQLKLVPKNIKPKIAPPEALKMYDEVIKQYTEVTKANFTNDYISAIHLLSGKKTLFTNLDKVIEKMPNKNSVSFIENLKNINDYCSLLAKSLLRLKLEEKD